MVMILVAPATSSILATNLAAIGTLGLSFLSCLAQPKYGITAVICLADALLAASNINSISIKFSELGFVEPTIKTLAPRTDSSKEGWNSPSLYLDVITFPIWAPKDLAIFSARA